MKRNGGAQDDIRAGVMEKSKHDMTPPDWRDYVDRVKASRFILCTKN